MMASLAQMERELTIERTRAGLEVARKLGRKGGRKRQMTDSKIKSAKKLLASGVPPRDVASNLGVSVPTLYRWIPASTMASGLGKVLALEGHFADAEKLERATLDIDRRVLGPTRPETVEAVEHLASIFSHEDDIATLSRCSARKFRLQSMKSNLPPPSRPLRGPYVRAPAAMPSSPRLSLEALTRRLP